MKTSIKILIAGILMFILGLTCVSYAGTYSSEEISYDTSTSGAVQNNVKDALDFLYNKTKSGASSECPENMSCVEKPGVIMNVTGPGTVDKGTVYVGLDESNTFTVTPNEGYTLASISCNNGYTLGSFSVLSTAGMSSQEITITNPGTTTGATCSITFSTNEISVSSINLSEYGADACYGPYVNCACYYINTFGRSGESFNYNGHTECNFKSQTCKYVYYNGGSSFDCTKIMYNWESRYWHHNNSRSLYAICSGVITCAT